MQKVHKFIKINTIVKTNNLTKMFRWNCSEVSQLDPFVFQSCLEQRVVLKDVVIWKDEEAAFKA